MLINKISHPIYEKIPISTDLAQQTYERKARHLVKGFKGEKQLMIIANTLEIVTRFTGDFSKHMSRKHKCENCNFKYCKVYTNIATLLK